MNPKAPLAVCPLCGKSQPDGRASDTGMRTLVGYDSPPGHDHDDNCRTRQYRCKCGHAWKVSKRNRCPVKGCDWKGKATCFCHPGEKVTEWPREAVHGEPVET